MSIELEVQKTETSPYVVLWQLDLTVLGDDVYYFIQGALEDEDVMFDGQLYTPFNLEAEGFEWNGQGDVATPKIRMSTSDQAITAFINSLSDMVGGKVTRIRTFKAFLDGQEQADPTAYLEKDTYVINTKLNENKYFVEFELSSEMDQQGVTLPRGKIVPYCRAKYRRYNGVGFTYNESDLVCPYVGESYFTDTDETTVNPALDVCSHLVSGCKLRFGEEAVLPFMGFPGVQRPTI